MASNLSSYSALSTNHNHQTNDVSWLSEDLKLFENEFDLFTSIFGTLARFITFIMAVIVHRAFYKLMKRLPGRAVNEVIYPYMVSDKGLFSRWAQVSPTL